MKQNKRKGISESIYAGAISTAILASMLLMSTATQTPGQNALQDGFSLKEDIGEQLAQKALKEGLQSLNKSQLKQLLKNQNLSKSQLRKLAASSNMTASELQKMLQGLNTTEKGLSIPDNSTMSNQTLNQTFNASDIDTNTSNSRNLSNSKLPENFSQELKQNPGKAAGLAAELANVSEELAKQIASILEGKNKTEPENTTEKDINPENNRTDSPKKNETEDNTTKGTSSEPEKPQNKTGQAPSQKENKQKEKGIGFKLPEGLEKTLPYLGALFLLLAAAVIYRYRKNSKNLLKTLIDTLRDAVVEIPDFFRRLTVAAIGNLAQITRTLLKKLKALIRSPAKFLAKMKKAWKQRIQKTKDKAQKISEKGPIKYIKGEEKEKHPEGIEKVWLQLKEAAGLEKKDSLTPEEIKQKASKEMSEEVVAEVAEAFRWEQYSSQEYPGKIKTDEWMKEVEKDGED